MPKKLDRCVNKVKKQGKDESSAYAICSSSTGYRKQKGGKWKKEKKKSMKESVQQPTDKTYVTKFIQQICAKDFSKAVDSLQLAVNEKIKTRINSLTSKEEK